METQKISSGERAVKNLGIATVLLGQRLVHAACHGCDLVDSEPGARLVLPSAQNVTAVPSLSLGCDLCSAL